MAASDAGRWLVDVGHSRIKRAEYRADGTLGMTIAESLIEFDDWASAHAGAQVLMAGARGTLVQDQLGDILEGRRITGRWLGLGEAPLPVMPAYGSLGVDRWLAFNAAWTMHRKALVVVDIGTATTLDVVDQGGAHRGGWILPGPEAAREGLLERAPGLDRPREHADLPLAPAVDTAQALERGLVLQQVGAVRLGLERAGMALGCTPRFVLTGGGASTLQSALNPDDLEPDLVLQGLALAASRMDVNPDDAER